MNDSNIFTDLVCHTQNLCWATDAWNSTTRQIKYYFFFINNFSVIISYICNKMWESPKECIAKLKWEKGSQKKDVCLVVQEKYWICVFGDSLLNITHGNLMQASSEAKRNPLQKSWFKVLLQCQLYLFTMSWMSLFFLFDFTLYKALSIWWGIWFSY